MTEISQALLTAEAMSDAAVKERDAWKAQLTEMNNAIAKAQEITNQVLFEVGLNPQFEPIAAEAAVAEEPIAVEVAAEEPIAVEAAAEEPIAVEAAEEPIAHFKFLSTPPLPPADTASPPFALKNDHGQAPSKRYVAASRRAAEKTSKRPVVVDLLDPMAK